MWHDPGDHTIELKVCSHLDVERRQRYGSGAAGRSGASTHTGHFDVVSPGDEQCRVILPVQATFEEVRAWAVGWPVHVRDADLCLRVVDLDSLENFRTMATGKKEKTIGDMLTKSFAHAIMLPRHLLVQMGPSPE